MEIQEEKYLDAETIYCSEISNFKMCKWLLEVLHLKEMLTSTPRTIFCNGIIRSLTLAEQNIIARKAPSQSPWMPLISFPACKSSDILDILDVLNTLNSLL